jgi:hypothetical protein
MLQVFQYYVLCLSVAGHAAKEKIHAGFLNKNLEYSAGIYKRTSETSDGIVEIPHGIERESQLKLPA